MSDRILPTDELYTLCNKKQWFTSGDVKQYEKLFEMNKMPGASIRDLAVIIWLCSTNCTIEEVKYALTEIFVREEL